MMTPPKDQSKHCPQQKTIRMDWRMALFIKKVSPNPERIDIRAADPRQHNPAKNEPKSEPPTPILSI